MALEVALALTARGSPEVLARAVVGALLVLPGPKVLEFALVAVVWPWAVRGFALEEAGFGPVAMAGTWLVGQQAWLESPRATG